MTYYSQKNYKIEKRYAFNDMGIHTTQNVCILHLVKLNEE